MPDTFSISQNPRLLARRLGFAAVRRDIMAIAGANLRIDWVLPTAPMMMDPVAVRGRREPSDARLAGFRARAEEKSSGHFITRARIEQSGNIFDVPVTVMIQHADGRITEQVVLATEPVTEARIPVTGGVRSVELNQDDAALAHFDRAR